MTITIPDNLLARLQLEATELGKTIEERSIDILESSIVPENNFDKAYIDQGLQDIKTLLTKIPCVQFVG